MVDEGRLRGFVKWFNARRGYGFALSSEEGGRDIFLHINCLPEGVESLREGQPITFTVETTRKGPRAINVQLES